LAVRGAEEMGVSVIIIVNKVPANYDIITALSMEWPLTSYEKNS
jgi:hypothetical protein